MRGIQKIDLSVMSGKFEKPSKFTKLKEGVNKVRVLSDPYLYYVVGKPTAKGFVRSIIQEGVEIPEFLRDVEPKQTYGFIIYNHGTKHFEVLETGSMLGVQLVQLIQEKYPDEFKAHDIDITAKGQKLTRTYEASYADKPTDLPKGLSKDSAEYRFVLSHFEGLR